jgi:hypothetical protein
MTTDTEYIKQYKVNPSYFIQSLQSSVASVDEFKCSISETIKENGVAIISMSEFVDDPSDALLECSGSFDYFTHSIGFYELDCSEFFIALGVTGKSFRPSEIKANMTAANGFIRHLYREVTEGISRGFEYDVIYEYQGTYFRLADNGWEDSMSEFKKIATRGIGIYYGTETYKLLILELVDQFNPYP